MCLLWIRLKSLKKQAVDGGGLAFHLTLSSSLETFYLKVEGVKEGSGLWHHLPVTHICALIPTQTARRFTSTKVIRATERSHSAWFITNEETFQMRRDTSHSQGENGIPNIFTVDGTDPSVSTKSCVKAEHEDALLHGLSSIRTKYSTAGVLSRCCVSISSGRVFFHVIQYWRDLDFWNELPFGAGCLSRLVSCMFTLPAAPLRPSVGYIHGGKRTH